MLMHGGVAVAKEEKGKPVEKEEAGAERGEGKAHGLAVPSAHCSRASSSRNSMVARACLRNEISISRVNWPKMESRRYIIKCQRFGEMQSIAAFGPTSLDE